MFSFLLWQLGCCLFKELRDPEVLMLLMPSGIFFLTDWSPVLTMSSDAPGKGKHAETQIMSSLAFDNFTLSAVQISQPDKLSLMPVLRTLNQMLGCSLYSPSTANSGCLKQHSDGTSQCCLCDLCWWPYLRTKVSVFKPRQGTLFTLSGDCEETRRVWWRRKNQPHMNSWNDVFVLFKIDKGILGLSKVLLLGHVSTSILDSDHIYLALCFLHACTCVRGTCFKDNLLSKHTGSRLITV